MLYSRINAEYCFLHIKALVEGMHLSECGDGNNLDHWYSGDRSQGAFCACIHFHHLCGFPRSLHLHHICPALRVKTSEGALQKMVEGKSCRVRLPQQALWRENIHIYLGELDCDYS